MNKQNLDHEQDVSEDKPKLAEAPASEQQEMTTDWKLFYEQIKKAVENMRE